MYKLFFCILFSCIFEFTIFGQYVTLQGRQFKDEHGGDFYPVVCNYVLSLPFVDTSGTFSFVIGPAHHYGGDIIDEYEPMENAIERIFYDFKEIRHMGFNSVRLMGLLTKNRNTDLNGQDKGYLNGFYSWDVDYRPNWDTIYKADWYQYQFPHPYNTDQKIAKLLNQYHKVIHKATDAGLYVILVPAVGRDLFKNNAEVEDFQDLLMEFCDTLKNEPNLLAYDLFNEPYFVDEYDHTKNEICQWTAQLYDAIHEVDSNHLITIGGGLADVMEWDPSLLKIDFWSPHFYPPYSEWIHVPYDSAMEKVTNTIIWIKNNCTLPWIIGETGFVAEDSESPSILVWGSETEQANYASQTLSTIRNAGGSGYSWWMFQHVKWQCDLPMLIPNHYPPGDDYHLDVGHYFQNNFGLLAKGEPTDCDTSTGECNYSALEKPVVDVFQMYLDPVTHQPPPQGSPPVPVNYGATGGTPPSVNSITAWIFDQDTVPIKDAVIQGWNLVKYLKLDIPSTTDTTDFETRSLCNNQVTFTDSTGKFTIIPNDFLTDSIENDSITQLKISCLGCEEYVIAKPEPNNPMIRYSSGLAYQINGDTIILKRDISGYINVISNKIIDFYPPVENFSAWNKIVIEDVTVVGDGTNGGISDITARNEIEVDPEFYAQKGSTVHMFLSGVFRDCGTLSFSKNGSIVGSNNNIEKSVYHAEEIELSFCKEDRYLFAYPNPTSGSLTLEIKDSDARLYKLVVSNMYGSCIKELQCKNITKIDLSNYPKGVYTITAYSDDALLGSCKIVLK